MLSFFARDVLDEIWDLMESVSEGFPTYSSRSEFFPLKEPPFWKSFITKGNKQKSKVLLLGKLAKNSGVTYTSRAYKILPQKCIPSLSPSGHCLSVIGNVYAF